MYVVTTEWSACALWLTLVLSVLVMPRRWTCFCVIAMLMVAGDAIDDDVVAVVSRARA